MALDLIVDLIGLDGWTDMACAFLFDERIRQTGLLI